MFKCQTISLIIAYISDIKERMAKKLGVIHTGHNWGKQNK